MRTNAPLLFLHSCQFDILESKELKYQWKVVE